MTMTPSPRPPRRALVLVLWLLALLAGIAVIARSHFSTDLSAFLPASPDARQQVLIEQLQSGVASRTLFIGIDGADGATRSTISREMGRQLRAGGLFDQVQNGDHSDWKDAGEWVFAHRYQLSPAVRPEHFTPEGLRNGILDTLSLLGTPAGNALRPLLERDPTGEAARIAEGLIPATAPRTEGGVWVARERERAVLLASTRAEGGDLDAQERAIAAIHSAFAQAQRQAGDKAGTARLLLSGTAVFSVQSRASIEKEAIHLAVVGAIVMSLILLAAFASGRALVVALLPVATGVVGGTAAVSLWFGNVHGLTLAFGSTLIGETVDYAIYYLIQARQVGAQGEPGTGWRHWLRVHWPTVRLGLLTSVVGFAALVFSGFPGLAQLGVFSIAGLVVAALATRFVLPSLAPDGATGQGLRRHLARATGVIVRTLPRLAWPFAALGVAALVLVLWQGNHLWRAGLASMSPVPKAAQELDAQLRADIGASEAATLVVAFGGTVEQALQHAEAASLRLDALVNEGKLLGYDSVTRFLPSQRTQAQRMAALPTAEELRARLPEATAGLPLAADRLAPFVEAVQAARGLAPITHEEVRAGTLGPIAGALLFERPGGGWAAMLSLHTPPDFRHATVADALAGLPEVVVVEVGEALADVYQRYLHEAFVQVGLGALAVVLLLAAWLRSARRLFAVCLPLVVAVLLTLGGMALLGMALSILHLVGLLLVVAVGSNYALFFDELQRTGHADEDTLASLLLANLTTVVSFTLIAISKIPALSAIGQVVAPGALLALLLSAAFAGGWRGRRGLAG
ncbi:MMPL family transporter [Xenophilus arseniciresistens]|uniref:MMPL family transporter n=1 Tax=Xenophilus arseniciresistens TaxID=1283306 RepID=A0AAE3T0K1_9BURK|nr:MMPL family transporter [Xenophilus arseniciresistens]MDA7418204.1 MMPL family transporter [Xenophilus arseniciresistens]